MGALAKGQAELDKLGESIDYLRPIVADADTGHGGALIMESSVMNADGQV